MFYPYDRLDISRLERKQLERFNYKSDEDDEDPDVLQLKKILMVKPIAFRDINNPSFEEIDPLSKQPLNQVMTLLSHIEQTTVADHEALSFILGLGRNEGSVWH